MQARSLASLLVALAALAGCSGNGGNGSGNAADAGSGFQLPDLGTTCYGPSAGSGTPSGTDPLCANASSAVSYARDVVPTISHCSGDVCHSAWTRDALVDKPSASCCDHRLLVVPGQPSSSLLIQAVRGVGACIPQMPLYEGSLSDSDIATLIAWVCEGAPNN